MKQRSSRAAMATSTSTSTSGGAYLGYAYLPEITDTAQAYLDGIVIDWRTLPASRTDVRRRRRRGRHARPRGRPLAEPRAHVLRPVQQERRLRQRHAAPEVRDVRLPRRQGHLSGPGPGPGAQLHGLLGRLVHVRSSPRDRYSGCATPGCSGERPESLRASSRSAGSPNATTPISSTGTTTTAAVDWACPRRHRPTCRRHPPVFPHSRRWIRPDVGVLRLLAPLPWTRLPGPRRSAAPAVDPQALACQ